MSYTHIILFNGLFSNYVLKISDVLGATAAACERHMVSEHDTWLSIFYRCEQFSPQRM